MTYVFLYYTNLHNMIFRLIVVIDLDKCISVAVKRHFLHMCELQLTSTHALSHIPLPPKTHPGVWRCSCATNQTTNSKWSWLEWSMFWRTYCVCLSFKFLQSGRMQVGCNPTKDKLSLSRGISSSPYMKWLGIFITLQTSKCRFHMLVIGWVWDLGSIYL